MCGYVSCFNVGSQFELINENNKIIHRGPDNQDYIWFDDINSGLSHCRL